MVVLYRRELQEPLAVLFFYASESNKPVSSPVLFEKMKIISLK
jgi:hypothetical protein